MNLKLYKVKSKEIFHTDDIKLEKDGIYIILDKHVKRPKIWIWSGSDANIQDKYIAGASATKIKSREKLYGATIEVVEDGNEPENFPIISEKNIIKPLEKEDQKIIEEIKVNTKDNIIKEEIKIRTTDDIKIDTTKVEKSEESNLLLKDQVKELLKEISLSLNNIKNKINNFLENL
ncbi:MAG: hypothetical protein ACFE9T_14915 [Promethearchaeota archaeon]